VELPIIIVNRIAKLSGALVKGFSYIFHFIFPKKRFTIPKRSEAWLKSSKETKIPKEIWQTNFTNEVTLPVYINYLFNRVMSLSYNYNYVSTEDRLEFMKQNASTEIYKAFEQLTDGASQADLWRVFVLNFKGGIYMDIDAHLVWPLAKIIQPDYNEIILLNKEHYTNYFIASAKNNPIMQKTIEIVVDNIQNKKVGNGVYDLTGPTTINLAIGDDKVNHRYYKITCIQGSFTNEHFQYIDKPRGKWTYVDKDTLLKERKD